MMGPLLSPAFRKRVRLDRSMPLGRPRPASHAALGGDTDQSFLSYTMALLGIVVLCLLIAAVTAPRLTMTLRAEDVQPDGGQAYCIGLPSQVHWPYVIPNHPAYSLTAADIALSEDGRTIGLIEPSHEKIRQLGGGRLDLWGSTLWFSTPDGDPREGGHSYLLHVKTRLDSRIELAGLECGGLLLFLIAMRLSGSVLLGPMDGVVRRGGYLSRAASGSPLAVSGPGCSGPSTSTEIRQPSIPLRSGFLMADLGLMIGLMLVAFRQTMPLRYEPDSYSYIEPGLRLASGQEIAHSSLRDLGYPALAYLAVKLGSLAWILKIQVILVMAGMACLLAIVPLFLDAVLFQKERISKIFLRVLPLFAVILSFSYPLLLLSNDDFMFAIYAVMAEAPHLLPMALAMLCFVGGGVAKSPSRRVILLSASTSFAFISTVVKPSSLGIFAVCAAGLLMAILVHWRQVRSVSNIAAIILTALVVIGVHGLDTWISPPGFDFGARSFFCNHLDVIAPSYETSTAERAQVGALMKSVLRSGPNGWPLQGFNGDSCFYDGPFIASIDAAAKSEHMSPKSWEMREFVRAVIANPLDYLHHVSRQLAYFEHHPIGQDEQWKGIMSDADWLALEPFPAMAHTNREAFSGIGSNWLTSTFPHVGEALDAGLAWFASSFALVTLVASSLAAGTVLAVRKPSRLHPEFILLASGAFTMALAGTVAASHTFDVERYITDILAFSLLWWMLSILFMLRSLALVLSYLLIRARERLEIGMP